MSGVSTGLVTTAMLDATPPSLRVTSIAWFSRFRRSGLRVGDRITAVNGQPMFIRLTSNAVLQPGFTPASPFDELLQHLLDALPPTTATQALIGEYYSQF